MLSPGSTYTEEFPATPDSVPRARAAVAGFALAAGATSHRLDDIRLAASEAVSNAVLHAYSAPGGSVQVTASYLPDELWLLIADDGAGLRPGGATGGLGVGLALIAQVADEFQVVARSSGGTQLQMRFRLRVAGPALRSHTGRPAPVTLSPA